MRRVTHRSTVARPIGAGRRDRCPVASGPLDPEPLLPTPLALAAAAVLVVVLAVAAAAKVRRPAETAEDFRAMGLPAAGWLAVVVPAVEVACALALVVVPGWGGVAAFGLLALFTANLVVVLRSGRAVRCACFGAASRAPVSRRHLLRNAGLMALALAAATIDEPIWRLEILASTSVS